MGFLDMGLWEILLVLVVALIIWGPGKLPEIARNLGRTVRTLRKMSQELTTQIKQELELEEEAERTHLASTDKEKPDSKPESEDKDE